jgi:hypothetical protein
MSSLLTNLSEKLHFHLDNDANDIAFDHFTHSNQPYQDLFEYLLTLTESTHHNTNLINCLIQSFLRWKNQPNNNHPISRVDQNLLNDLILKNLPIVFLKDCCEIFQIPKDLLLFLLRTVLNDSTNSSLYKRALNIIVKFQYQLEFSVEEILLPLILNTKDHLIHLFIDKNPQLEDYLLDLLNHLYQHGGKRLREILANEFNIRNSNLNKKALGKLAVRYWNLFGNERNKKYSNLATLQHNRTLGYLINVKYSGNTDEKTMSDEAWNELVEVKLKSKSKSKISLFLFQEIVKENNDDLSEYLIELLVDRDDINAVHYWSKKSIRFFLFIYPF